MHRSESVIRAQRQREPRVDSGADDPFRRPTLLPGDQYVNDKNVSSL